MEKDPFEEYLRETEPDKAGKGYAWSTAIGLQAVDGLKPSKYLIDTAIQNIEGKITLKEAKSLIESYYEKKPVRLSDDGRTEEADKVSSRIAEILLETAFSFSPNEYISIHRRLFQGIYKHAGKIRDYNITKKEWVLDGATVMYGSASELRATLEYDFFQEKDFSYKGLSMDDIIHHLAVLRSYLDTDLFWKNTAYGTLFLSIQFCQYLWEFLRYGLRNLYMTALRQSAMAELERVPEDKLIAIIQFIDKLLGEDYTKKKNWDLDQFSYHILSGKQYSI